MTTKKILILNIFWFSFLLFSISFCAEIRGKVLDENTNPFEGANVYLEGTILGSTTNYNGEFVVNNVPTGNFILTISVIGYHQENIQISISENKSYQLENIQLIPSPISGEPVVITASKYKQKVQDVPVSVSSFDRKEINYRNSITIDKALQYVSGLNMNRSQVNIRGSSGYSLGVGSRVLFLLDGIPFLTGDTREINFETIPTYLVDHVEILKGAGSALYGSSALGGVVNIITSNLVDPGTFYFATMYGGFYSGPSYKQWKWSDGTRYLSGGSFTVSHKKKNLGFIVGASQNQDDGYRQNDWSKRYSASSKIQWAISPYQQLTISTNYMTKKRGNFLYWKGINDALIPPTDQRDDRVITHRYYLTTNYHYILDKKQYFTFRSIWFWNKVEDTVSEGAENKAISNNGNFELQYNSQLGNIFFTSGIEGTLNTVNSDMFGNRDGVGSAFYLQGEYPITDKMKTTLGIRFDYFNIDSIKSDNQFNPKFGLIYKFLPGGVFRTSFGLGFRAPSMAEAFISTSAGGFRIKPNTNLRPEKSYNYEIGWNQIFSSWLLADVALFYSRYSDLIEGTFLPQTIEIQFQNITRAQIRGAEIGIKGHLMNKRLIWSIGYTYIDPWDMENGGFLNYRPRHIFNSFTQYNFGFLNFGLDYRYIKRYDQIDQRLSLIIPDAEERVDAHVVDCHFSVPFKVNSIPLNANLQINNLLKYNYTDIVGALAPIQNFVFSLKTNF